MRFSQNYTPQAAIPHQSPFGDSFTMLRCVSNSKGIRNSMFRNALLRGEAFQSIAVRHTAKQQFSCLHQTFYRHNEHVSQKSCAIPPFVNFCLIFNKSPRIRRCSFFGKPNFFNLYSIFGRSHRYVAARIRMITTTTAPRIILADLW